MKEVCKDERALKPLPVTIPKFDISPADPEIFRSGSLLQTDFQHNDACISIDINPDSELYLTIDEMMETKPERLVRWKNFFNHRPLMRCLDPKEGGINPEKLFDVLFEEVCFPTDASHLKRKQETQSRAFWQNVRDGVHVDDDEIGYAQGGEDLDEECEKGEECLEYSDLAIGLFLLGGGVYQRRGKRKRRTQEESHVVLLENGDANIVFSDCTTVRWLRGRQRIIKE